MGIRFHYDSVSVFAVEVYEPSLCCDDSALGLDGSQGFLFHPSVDRRFRVTCDSADIVAEEQVGFYKPFIIRKLIERGIVKTVKSAKKIVDRKDAVV